MYNWKNNPNLSSKTDSDYTSDVIDVLTSELSKTPNNHELLFSRGNGYLDLGKYQDAIIDYSRIIDELDLEIDTVYNNRGICYRSTGQFDLAIHDFDKAIKINPSYRDAFNNKGMVLADLGNYDEAIRNYSISIDLDTNYWYAYNNRAMSYWELGNIKKAKMDYEIVRSLVGH
tara:strand:- start:492 stop:1010 length:519 start_codon:yes stop_codon:yes gene_type:complete